MSRYDHVVVVSPAEADMLALNAWLAEHPGGGGGKSLVVEQFLRADHEQISDMAGGSAPAFTTRLWLLSSDSGPWELRNKMLEPATWQHSDRATWYWRDDDGDITVGVVADKSVYLTGVYGPHGYDREGQTTQTVRRG